MELSVGRIVKSHGIRGEVVVEVRTDSPAERFAADAQLGVRRGRTTNAALVEDSLTVAAARNHSGRLLVRFVGIESRDAADALRGVELTVDSEDLEPLSDEDEFYDHQLIGLAVIHDGQRIGQISDVMHTPAGEVLAVTPDPEFSPQREVLIPFVRQFVPDVDLSGGSVTITPPEGLLDLGEADSASAK